MENPMNIYQKMAGVTADVKKVVKSLTVETGKGKGYRAVSESDIIDAVKPLEEKYGIYSYPRNREIIEHQTIETETEYQGKTNKKITYFSRIKTTYRFVNIDDPPDYIDMIVFSEGIDSGDKGSGKAMTYADKYALMKAYKIRTGNDPDQTPVPDKPGYVLPDQEDEVIRCAVCNAQLYNYWDGRVLIKAKRLADRSVELHNCVLCPDCMKMHEKRMRDEAAK